MSTIIKVQPVQMTALSEDEKKEAIAVMMNQKRFDADVEPTLMDWLDVSDLLEGPLSNPDEVDRRGRVLLRRICDTGIHWACIFGNVPVPFRCWLMWAYSMGVKNREDLPMLTLYDRWMVNTNMEWLFVQKIHPSLMGNMFIRKENKDEHAAVGGSEEVNPRGAT